MNKPLNKLFATIEIKRTVPYTTLKIIVPDELTEVQKEIRREVVFRTYGHAMRYVAKIIEETQLPLVVNDKVKKTVHKVRIHVPVARREEVLPELEVAASPRYRPDRLLTIECSNEDIKRDNIDKILRLKDRGQISDFDFINKLLEVS